MRVVATSDCHGHLPGAFIPPGDVLVLAGDILADAPEAHPDPDAWQAARLLEVDDHVGRLGFAHALLVAGNHDRVLQRRPEVARELRHLRYLEDEDALLDGVRFWGSPWQPGHVAPKHAFFLADGWPSRRTYGRIPADTQVLITHSPPWGVLDVWEPPVHEGSRMLAARLFALRPRVHVFGHVHPSHGRLEERGTLSLNVAMADGKGRPLNTPRVFEL